MQKPEPLTPKAHCHVSDTGRIVPRLVEASDQPRLDRVHACAEDDRNGRRQAFDHACRVRAGGSGDDRNAATDQIAGQFRQPIELLSGPTKFNRDYPRRSLAP